MIKPSDTKFLNWPKAAVYLYENPEHIREIDEALTVWASDEKEKEISISFDIVEHKYIIEYLVKLYTDVGWKVKHICDEDDKCSIDYLVFQRPQS